MLSQKYSTDFFVVLVSQVYLLTFTNNIRTNITGLFAKF